MADSTGSHDEEEPPVRVTDKRRLDPESGALRDPAQGGEAHEGAGSTPASEAGLDEPAVPERDELAERTEDLLRLKAEYDNYRRRVERDRAGWGDLAVAKVVSDLLPALDDIDRAKAHDQLEGAFRAVAEQVEKVVLGAGLTRFGAVGEPFDPARHEALTSLPSPGVTAEQVLEVYRAGYEFSGRVLRAAQVVVALPTEADAPA